jgi:hypothetical protein
MSARTATIDPESLPQILFRPRPDALVEAEASETGRLRPELRYSVSDARELGEFPGVHDPA